MNISRGLWRRERTILRNTVILVAIFWTVLLCNCGNKPEAVKVLPMDTDSLSHIADTTLYGVCGESGMSTFCLITDKSDTIYASLTDMDGNYAQVFGDEEEGDKFAIIWKKNEEALVRAINLTQLNSHLDSYLICNGSLVLRNGESRDTVTIKSLDSNGLVVTSASGKDHRFLHGREVSLFP